MPSIRNVPSSRLTTRGSSSPLGHLADQGLEDVGQRRQPFEVAVFVDDERHRLAARLEHLERAQHGHRVRQVERRAQCRARIEFLAGERRVVEVLDLDDAGELMRPALHHRKARKAALADLPAQLLFAVVEIEELDLRTRRHHPADPPLAEPQRALDDRGLGLRDVAGRNPFAQQERDLLVGHRHRLLPQRQ